MRIPLSSHFTYKKLLQFVFPSVMMMIFTSIYSVVDGFFVSNFVGKTSFAAVNLMMPILIIVGAIGFMIGAGGTAIVAKTLGEGQTDKANRIFSLMIYTVIAGGIALTIISLLLLRPIAVLLGARGQMLTDALLYSRIILIANTFFMLQNVFQTFLIAAEKQKLGLAVTIIAGITNMVLDYLFVAVLHWGLAGAAIATGISQTIGGLIPLIYFLLPNNSLLQLTKTTFNGKILLRACVNGSSELMSNISASVVTMLYNFQLLKLAGENGVAAYGAIMYVNFIFAAVFFGYSLGSAPIISYHYGADNQKELQNLYHKSLMIMGIIGCIMAILSFSAANPFARLFVGYDQDLFQLTLRGFRLYAFSFLICGFNLFGSSFFTALNNGGVSAAISFLRTLVFQTLCIMILPLLLNTDGIWLATLAAEILSLTVTCYFLLTRKKQYGY